jgi:hypothetical protein
MPPTPRANHTPVTNPRRVPNGDLMPGIVLLGKVTAGLVAAVGKAERLARSYEARPNEVAALVRGRPKPKVYFEEWDDPLIGNSSRSLVARTCFPN